MNKTRIPDYLKCLTTIKSHHYCYLHTDGKSRAIAASSPESLSAMREQRVHRQSLVHDALVHSQQAVSIQSYREMEINNTL